MLAAAAAVVAAASAAPCTVPEDAEVLARSAAVVAYARDREVSACSRRSGGRLRLQRLAEGEEVVTVAAAGERVLTVVRTRSRRRTTRSLRLQVQRVPRPAVERQVVLRERPGEAIARVALDPSGAFAYASRTKERRGIHLVNAPGHRPVDLRPGVALGSLRVDDGRFRWRQAGRGRSERVDAAPPSPGPRCSIPRSAVVLTRTPVVSYELELRGAETFAARLYGCLPGVEPRALGATGHGDEFDVFGARIAGVDGDRVAVVRSSGVLKYSKEAVVAVDLRSGSAGPPTCESFRDATYDDPIYEVGAAAVSPSGAVACIRFARSLADEVQDAYVEVQGPDGPRVLDRGRAIDPRFLRLDGTVLRWRDGGQDREAQLP